METVIADPPVRKDGLCHVCLKPRGIPKGAWARDAAARDPFCSSSCARQHFGQPDLDAQGQAAKGSPSREITKHAFPRGGFKHGTREGYELCACDLCTAAVKEPA